MCVFTANSSVANSYPSGWINATLIFVIRHSIASRLRTAPCYATKCHITTPTPGLHAYIETGEPWPLARYVKLQIAHAPRIPGTFSPPPRVSDPDMHHGTCVTHVLWCMPGSLTSGFRWKSVGGKRSRHSRRMRNPQFYVSGKRPTGQWEDDNGPVRIENTQLFFQGWGWMNVLDIQRNT